MVFSATVVQALDMSTLFWGGGGLSFLRLVTVEVGSRGILNVTAFNQLRTHLDLSASCTKELLIKSSEFAIRGSHKIMVYEEC
jgi:hypothetical protein